MSVYKRKYSKGKKPIWWVDYRDASGKRVRRSSGTSNKQEAESLEAKWKLEVYQQKQWDKDPEHTFDELMLEFLRETTEKKPSAWVERIHVAHLYGELSGKVLSSLADTDVKKYIKARKSYGIKDGTINRELTTLSSALNFGRTELKWDIPNPVSECKLEEPAGRVRWITHEEAQKLIDAVKDSVQAPHMSDFLRLALNTGCRSGEMLGLEWNRVDMSAGLILLEAEHTKNRKRRSVPLNQEAYSAILGRARFRAEYCPDSPWVFSHKDGARLKSVKTAFKVACKKIGIEDFRIHDLRHTCAAWLVQARVPLPEIRDLLGHSSIKMTEKYAHLNPDNIRKAVAVLDNLSRFGHDCEKGKKKQLEIPALTA
ncbi:MAG: site-specific integrase [Magnetococcales bacterium]|nr:site-specific integrase [Magnetococcales bacterium]